jgi:hypothetical protein
MFTWVRTGLSINEKRLGILKMGKGTGVGFASHGKKTQCKVVSSNCIDVRCTCTLTSVE